MSDKHSTSFTPIIVGAVIAILGILTGFYIADNANRKLEAATAHASEDSVSVGNMPVTPMPASTDADFEPSELPPLDPMEIPVPYEEPVLDEMPVPEQPEQPVQEVEETVPEQPVEEDEFEEVPLEELEQLPDTSNNA